MVRGFNSLANSATIMEPDTLLTLRLALTDARYKAALEARDMTALKQVWPALSGRQETATRSEFENSRSIADPSSM